MSWFWTKEIPTKPEDIVQYKIGFACEAGHCQSTNQEPYAIEDYSRSNQICLACGWKSFPSVIKETTGHCWQRVPFSSCYWGRKASTYEFVRFLDEDTVRLEEETVATLRRYAARKFQESDENADLSYQKGLNDGTIMTAKYVLGELKEEKNA
jgi:hypothetical protein